MSYSSILKSMRIKNLRSLQDTGEMEIKPINILVGVNSSGKSTFLRFFPLMKQSLRRKVNGPILWSGEDDDYVDFGSFDEALNNNAEEKKISFKFSLNIDIFNEYIYKFKIKKNQKKYKNSDVDIEISLSKCKNSLFDYISKLLINILEYKISVEIDESGKIESAKINNKNYDIEYKENNLEMLSRWGVVERVSSPFYVNLDILEDSVLEYINNARSIDILNNIEYMIAEKKFMDYMFLKSVIGLEVDISDSMLSESQKSFMKDFIKKIEEKNRKLESNEILMMYHLPKIYKIISEYISLYFINTYYIAPVRATAERYYRLRNTAVDEVDCRGKNLAIFLNSLTADLFNKFQEWTRYRIWV